MSTPQVNTYILIGQRRPSDWGGWSQMVCVGDRLYIVSVRTGKRIRIPYKPRGPGAFGHQWIGRVHSVDDGPRIEWENIVGGSIGVRGMLRYAGILTAVSTEPKLDTQTEIYQQCYNNDRSNKS